MHATARLVCSCMTILGHRVLGNRETFSADSEKRQNSFGRQKPSEELPELQDWCHELRSKIVNFTLMLNKWHIYLDSDATSWLHQEILRSFITLFIYIKVCPLVLSLINSHCYGRSESSFSRSLNLAWGSQ